MTAATLTTIFDLFRVESDPDEVADGVAASGGWWEFADGDWDEDAHPRSSGGRFAPKDSGGAVPDDGEEFGKFSPKIVDIEGAYESWLLYDGCTEIRYAAEMIIGQGHAPSLAGVPGITASQPILTLIGNGGDESAIGPNGEANILTSYKMRDAAERVDEAYTMLDAVEHADPVDFPLYRGVEIRPDVPGSEDLLKLQAGDQFDLSLASTSPDPNVARSFSGQNRFDEENVLGSVIFQVEPGARAMPDPRGQGHAREVEIGGEQVSVPWEYVVGGRMEVVDVKHSDPADFPGGKPVVSITVRQTGVFDPRTGELARDLVAAAVAPSPRYVPATFWAIFNRDADEALVAAGGDWDEDKHPRGAGGRWASSDGGGEPEGVALNDAHARMTTDKVRETTRFEYDRLAGKGPIPPIEELKDRVAAAYWSMAQGPIAVQVPTAAVEKILADGQLKTQRETGTSSGLLVPNTRDDAEKKMFGTVGQIYGAVDRPDVGTRSGMYGDVQLILKDEVRDRATVTFGDSLGWTPAPLPANFEPGEDPDRVLAAVGTPSPHGPLQGFMQNGLDIVETGSMAMEPYYTETQIHGGVTLDDIAEVRYRSKEAREQVAPLIEGAGIKSDGMMRNYLAPPELSNPGLSPAEVKALRDEAWDRWMGAQTPAKAAASMAAQADPLAGWRFWSNGSALLGAPPDADIGYLMGSPDSIRRVPLADALKFGWFEQLDSGLVADGGDWDESKHPRGAGGRWGSKESSDGDRDIEVTGRIKAPAEPVVDYRGWTLGTAMAMEVGSARIEKAAEDVVGRPVPERHAITGAGGVNDVTFRAELKGSAVEIIGARMAQDPQFQEWAGTPGGQEWCRVQAKYSREDSPITREEVEHLNAGGVATPEVAGKVLADNIARGWAASAADHAGHALALQWVAAEMFGVPEIETPKIDAYGEENPGLQAEIYQRVALYGPAMESFLRATYEETQSVLRDGGVESMTLARGHISDSEVFAKDGTPYSLEKRPGGGVVPTEAVVSARMNPLSSWSTNLAVAEQFAAGTIQKMNVSYPGVYVAEVPRERILSIPSSGMGCLPEHEVVVIGGDPLEARMVPFAGASINYTGWKHNFAEPGLAAAGSKQPKFTVYLDDPPNDDWPKQTDDSMEALGLAASAGDWDEDKHPRGAGGRWASNDEGPTSDVPVAEGGVLGMLERNHYAEIKHTFEELLEGPQRYGDSGVYAIVTEVIPLDPPSHPGRVNSNRFTVNVDLYNEDDAEIGRVSRTFWADRDGRTAVEHTGAYIGKQQQQHGVMTDLNRRMEDFYRANGVDRIELLAAGDGAEVWAKAGFDFDTRPGGRVPSSIRHAVGEHDAFAESSTGMKLLALWGGASAPSPLDVLNAPEGKEVLREAGWAGVKRLNPDAVVASGGDWDEEKHPRGAGGRWASTGEGPAATSMVNALRQAHGGFTLTSTGTTPLAGYAVATVGHSKAIPGDEFFAGERGSEAGRQALAGYIMDNLEALSEPGAHLGGWRSPPPPDGDDKVWLDVTTVIGDKGEAVRLATERNEQGIMDLGAIAQGTNPGDAYISTGGTGAV